MNCSPINNNLEYLPPNQKTLMEAAAAFNSIAESLRKKEIESREKEKKIEPVYKSNKTKQ